MSEATKKRWREMLEAQPLLPSPMCGISDHPFRQMCRERGGPLAYTQMVAAHGMVRRDPKTISILDLQGEEPLLGMQLFGNDPALLGESAAILEELGADVVDLNMGCPARKVTAGCGGSALLREPELCRQIFKAMRAALTVPFTVKMRWDWDDDGGRSIDIARMAEDEGADGVCLHARTRKEAYSGEADWSRIARLKQAVSIPVVGNGDVRAPEDARRMMHETGCDGVMIGRAAIGNPWLMGGALRAAADYLRFGGDHEPEETYPGSAADWEERRTAMLRHAGYMAASRGERHGVVLFRKHASAYMRGIRGVKQIRPRLMQVDNLADLESVLNELRPELSDPEETCAVGQGA